MGQLREVTNFAEDVKNYGPIGEEDLKEILKNSPKSQAVYDVTDIPEYQGMDIDILQEPKAGYATPSGEKYASYEVKTDTFGAKSRNMVYEIFSNGNEGCLIRSKADYVYYVFIDDKTKQITERFLIKKKELNTWMMSNFGNINKDNYFKAKFMNRKETGDRTGIFLINIDHLVENKIAIKITR